MNAAERWSRLPRGGRVVIVVVGALVAIELTLATIESATGGSGPSGPPSSSYATKGDGLAAYADLLARARHPVTRLRTEVQDVDPAATLVVADASLDPDEIDAAGRFVDGGGRLVLVGEAGADVADQLLEGDVGWSPDGGKTARAIVPPVGAAAELAAATPVRTNGEGVFTSTGAALPVLAAGDKPVVAVAQRGAGSVVMVADSSALQNRSLAHAANAALGLSAAGGAGRPVIFNELGHGYGRTTGLSALPPQWRWGLLIATLGTLVWVWSRGRRLGPPDVDDEPEPPRRRVYVDAIAATLLRTGDAAGAIAPVQQAARERVAQRTGAAPDADDAIRKGAIACGLSEHDADAIISPVRSHDDAIRAARAFAKLGER